MRQYPFHGPFDINYSATIAGMKGGHILLFTLEWDFIQTGVGLFQLFLVHSRLGRGNEQRSLRRVAVDITALIIVFPGQEGIVAECTDAQH